MKFACPVSKLHPFEDPCRAHAAADAHADEPIPRLTAAHFVQQRRRQLRPGAAEGMAERDRPAVDVQPVSVDRQIAEAGYDLRGKRLVELDEINLIEAEVC